MALACACERSVVLRAEIDDSSGLFGFHWFAPELDKATDYLMFELDEQ